MHAETNKPPHSINEAVSKPDSCQSLTYYFEVTFPRHESDDNISILRAVETVTGEPLVEDGADLIGDPELAEKYREAMRQAKTKPVKPSAD